MLQIIPDHLSLYYHDKFTKLFQIPEFVVVWCELRFSRILLSRHSTCDPFYSFTSQVPTDDCLAGLMLGDPACLVCHKLSRSRGRNAYDTNLQLLS